LFRIKRANYGRFESHAATVFYLPDGESTQLKGVAADVILPS